MSRFRLAELPFLAATLAMALALILPWALGGPAAEPRGVEIQTPLRLAGQAGIPQP